MMEDLQLADVAKTADPTGFNDRHGIPIYCGDLIRVPHYVHRRGKRQMWLYFRVARLHGRCVVQNWNDLDASKWQCSLDVCGVSGAEVIAESGLYMNERGELITFNERPRKRPAHEKEPTDDA
jgi:hypothetical protein